MLGGDGTFLRAARAIAEVDVPILGINLGKVGFLSKAEADELEGVLEQARRPAPSTFEERMALDGPHPPGRPDDRTATFTALNDIVVARGSLARVVRLDVAIDESHLATFIADGLVVSSPTGSTGYSFSAGGPILDPSSRNLVVTPIAGYLSTIRSRRRVARTRSSGRGSWTRTRRSCPSTGARTAGSRSATSSRSARSSARSGSSSPTARCRSGTCSAQGRAAAAVTTW